MNNTTIKVATDDSIRAWLQGQIKGCLKTYGIQALLYPVIQHALSEITPLSDSQRETGSEALDRLRETDWKLSMGDWSEARRAMAEAHDALREVGVAVDSGVSWRRELDLQITELIESIEYAMIDPGDSAWTAWRGAQGCTILTLQPYYRDSDLQAVLDAWEDGAPVKIVDGALTAEIVEYED